MEKVLIISYFFPPSNFVGGRRTEFWAKELHKYNYYPIVLTRLWNENQVNLSDKVHPNKLIIEKNKNFEIHRLPVRKSLRRKLDHARIPSLIKKGITLWDTIISTFIFTQSIHYNFYTYLDELLNKDPKLNLLIISGRPFESFQVGYEIKRKHDRIMWFADYRDEWTTFQNKSSLPLANKLTNIFHRQFEKKWTSNCNSIITVSENWLQSIQKIIDKPGQVVMNGFDNTGKYIESKTNNKLTLSYIGSLYPNQDINVLFNGIRNCLYTDMIKIVFVGVNFIDGQKKRVIEQSKGLNIELIERIPREKLENYIAQTDVFFLTNLTGVKGWFPVKIFDYLKWRRPIVLCPGDSDVLDQIILRTNSGYIINDSFKCASLLESLYLEKQNIPIDFNPNESEVKKYSRQYQTKILARILDSKSQLR